MYAKIRISGKIELLSGMHIGGSGAFSAIGAVDSPVVKDRLTGLPLLPGSSLKGKMRSLLARMYNEKFAKLPDGDHPKLLRLSAPPDRERTARRTPGCPACCFLTP